MTERAGIVLFVGTRPGQQRAIVEAAERAGGYHLFTRWIPGTITNRDWILANTALKAVNEHDEEVEKYGDQVRALDPIVPDLVVCLNPTDNKILLRECGMANIPTIGVVDTDCDPTCVTYPIPANDDRCDNCFPFLLIKVMKNILTAIGAVSAACSSSQASYRGPQKKAHRRAWRAPRRANT